MKPYRTSILFSLVFVLYAFFLSTNCCAQNERATLERVKDLLNEDNDEEAYQLLCSLDEQVVETLGDSCVMMYNYEKGFALFSINKYEEAIPFLNKALLTYERIPHEDCGYIELNFYLASCYNELKQYDNAEKYFRKVIIREKAQQFRCAVVTKAYDELITLYNNLNYTKLAEECASKINSRINDIYTDDWQVKVDMLLDMANSSEQFGKFEEEIEVYHMILDLIQSNIGKDNEDYLCYSDRLSMILLLHNKEEEAIPILEDIISVGKNYVNYNTFVCSAYENLLEIKAKQNDTLFVKRVLPDAINYFQHTKGYDWQNHNLYEIIGNAFFEAGNDSCGRTYLEKPWNNKLSLNIRAIGNLGIYYYDKNPQKSLSLFKTAESLIHDSTDIVTKKVIYSYINTLCSKLNQYDEAVKYAELVAPYIKEVDGNDTYASHLISWALALINAKQPQKAFLLFKEVDDYLPELSDRTKIYYYSQYGFASIGASDYQEAIKALNKGIALSIEMNGESNMYLTPMYHNLGRAYMLVKDYENARLYLNKSKDLQIKQNGEAMQRTLEYIKECESK